MGMAVGVGTCAETRGQSSKRAPNKDRWTGTPEIDSHTVRPISISTPVAGDVWFPLMTARINANMEWIADQAVNTAEDVVHMVGGGDSRHTTG